MAKTTTTKTTTKTELKRQVAAAIAACEDKKAAEIATLELDQAHSGFTDYFVICSGSNPRQIQAISDEVEQRLGGEAAATPPLSAERLV